MTVVIDKHITINCVEDVVHSVGVVFTIVLRMEPQTYELIMDFLLGSQPGFGNIWLNKYSTYTTILILGKAYHVVRASVKIAVMRFNTFEERCQIIVGITEVIQFDDLLTIYRKIGLVFRPSVKEITEQAAVIEPAPLLLSPLLEPYQLDRFASRCSRKSLNLLKDSLRDCGCSCQ